ncbi:MAG: type II toxin-antitoxin system ParD family antitoxin [Thermoprotei archaeon]|nr:type II toxin-antitoxin system ParD family antitoxin [Thermoprotei archaeon]
MKLITVHLPESYIEGLNELIKQRMYPSRSEAIRAAVRDLLKKELWREKKLRMSKMIA